MENMLAPGHWWNEDNLGTIHHERLHGGKLIIRGHLNHLLREIKSMALGKFQIKLTVSVTVHFESFFFTLCLIPKESKIMNLNGFHEQPA
jgi:hypothetical protein